MASTGKSDGSSRDSDEKYDLLLELGQGGSAQVFLAVMDGGQGVDKLVVLKFLKASLSNDTELQKMFLSEARFSARLNHANIVQTSAIVQERGGPAIVMEYLEGQSLSAVLTRTRATIPLTLHVRILADVLRGLHYAHELTDISGKPFNVVHRDVSPQNVFITYDGQVKLIDFGIAKLADSGVETAMGIVKGKIRYMPPEQLESREVDRRADVFAVGVMLWEAATREKIWKGRPDPAILHQILHGEIPAPRSIRPDVPEELERIILKALSLKREDRHATAGDLEADLEAFLSTSAPITGREISRFISSEFAAVRAETKRIIELHLKRRATIAETAGGSEAVPPPLSQSLARGGYATTSSSSSTLQQGAAPPKRRFGLGVALASAAAIVLLLWKASVPSPRPNMAVSAAPSTPALPSGPAESAPIPAVVATPPEAATEQAPSASAPAKPRPTPQRGPGPLPRSAATPAVTAVAAPPPPAADHCTPPFFMDKNGIKKPKPECL